MTPNLENVTTLDHVELTKPSAHALRLKNGDNNNNTGSSSSSSSDTSAGGGGGAPKRTYKGDKGPPSNRIQANEQALRYFKDDWDVYWNSNSYRIIGGS
jgi:hypothetical protein